MVKNPKKLQEFEDDLMRKNKPDYHRNLKIVNALLREAIRAGKFPSKNRLEDIEIDIRFAKAINSVR